jgi:hypothetical protein
VERLTPPWLSLFTYLGCIGAFIEDLVLVRQTLYHFSHSTSPF